MEKLPLLPKRIGIAADLVFIVQSPIGFIADCLLVYDQIVIPGDPITIGMLYRYFGTKQMLRMLKIGRLAFCPSMSRHLSYERKNKEYSRSGYLSLINKYQLGFYKGDEQKEIVRQVDNHLVVGAKPNYLAWEQISEIALSSFEEMAARPGYEFLYPIKPNTGGTISLDRRVGLEAGLARMNDLTAAGIIDMEVDGELVWLLDICFPGKSSLPLVSTGAVESDATRSIENLHRINNLPSLGQVVAMENWTAERMLDVALSDDADELRGWLNKNLSPGIDVREAYIQSFESLPSKKTWTGWLRFGTINAVTTAIGAMVGNPIAGASLGLAISAADQQIGQKTLEVISDPYHPKEWLSLAGRGYDI